MHIVINWKIYIFFLILCLRNFSPFGSAFVKQMFFFFNFKNVMQLLQISVGWESTFLIGGIEVSQKALIVLGLYFLIKVWYFKIYKLNPRNDSFFLSNISFSDFFVCVYFSHILQSNEIRNDNIKSYLDWVAIVESISGNQERKRKKIFAKKNKKIIGFSIIEFEVSTLCQNRQTQNKVLLFLMILFFW